MRCPHSLCRRAACASICAPICGAAPARPLPCACHRRDLSEAPAAYAVAPVPTPPPLPTSHPAPTPTPNPVSAHERDTDPAHLHPAVRQRVAAVEAQLAAERIPMRLFEGFRAPERQAHLYAQGRTRPGGRVTNAAPWGSYHQYGLAADFVRFEGGAWNWNDATEKEAADWSRFHAIARDHGLEPLSWERPHVQIIDVTLSDLRAGAFPEGGDEPWARHLAAAIARYPADAPPAPTGAEGGADRPPMPLAPPRPPAPHLAPAPPPLDWRSIFGGDAWAVDGAGVRTRDHAGGLKTWRSAGAPITVQEVIAQNGPAIDAAAARHGVARALIIMTIAVETGAFRRDGFTGPKTWRWEPRFPLGATGDPAIDGRERGDYSAGPMQVMSTTARWINEVMALGHDPAKTLRWYKRKPATPPARLGLYDPATCIDIGTAYIKHQMPKTGGDPILVAAAYNAGSLRPSSGNRWRLHSSGDHIDRAAAWYGDACFVLNG